MVSAEEFSKIALAFERVSRHQHFDRTAFKARVIFATLAADGLSANIKFSPEDQQFKVMLAPEIFSALDNAWGRQGWTRVDLAAANAEELRAALGMAYQLAKVIKKQSPSSGF